MFIALLCNLFFDVTGASHSGGNRRQTLHQSSKGLRHGFGMDNYVWVVDSTPGVANFA